MRRTKRLWIVLIVLALLSPLGLIIPARFGAGSAWGEWSAEELRRIAGCVPSHLGRLSTLWRAPVPDYALPGQERALCGSYILSALLGAAVVCAAALLIGRMLRRKDDSDAS